MLRISKQAAENLKGKIRRNCCCKLVKSSGIRQSDAYDINDIFKEIDSMVEPEAAPGPPVHVWKVGNKALAHGKYYGAVEDINEVNLKINGTWFNKYDCIPIHFIQTAESTIGEGSVVRTKGGWVGSVLEDIDGAWQVISHGKTLHNGWYAAAELTLCAPEVK